MLDVELARARQRLQNQKNTLSDSEATYKMAVEMNLLATQRSVGSKLTRQREAVKISEAMVTELEKAIAANGVKKR